MNAKIRAIECGQCGQIVRSDRLDNHQHHHPDNQERDFLEPYQALINDYQKPGIVMSTFNNKISMLSKEALVNFLNEVFHKQQTAFRINISLGYVLENRETEEKVFYSSSQNNRTLFKTPQLIRNYVSKENLVQRIQDLDLLSIINRPNTKYAFVSITNSTFYVYKIDDNPICGSTQLPNYLLTNKGLVSLIKNNRGIPYTDNNCFFRCVSIHLGFNVTNLEKKAKELRHDYCKANNIEHFDGVPLTKLEECSRTLGFGINVFIQDNDHKTKLIFITTIQTNIMHLNLFGEHFSYIKSFGKYSHSYYCESCDKFFSHHGTYKRHNKSCTGSIKHEYTGGRYRIKTNIFEKLESAGINISKDLRIFPFRAVFDYECYLSEEIDIASTDKVRYVKKHCLASVSIASNVPNFTNPHCLVIDDTGSSGSVKRMLAYLKEISKESKRLIREIYSDYWSDILNSRYFSQFMEYINQLPVLTFNGAKYDLKVVRQDLIPALVSDNSIKYVIKKDTQYMCICTSDLKFLDICFYIAPGFNYAKFLKAHSVEESKGYFPYEYFDSIQKLEETAFPTISEFKDIDTQKYFDLQNMFYRNNWTFKDYLIYYNNLDTSPFITALNNLVKYYFSRSIDPFKDAFSGITIDLVSIRDIV